MYKISFFSIFFLIFFTSCGVEDPINNFQQFLIDEGETGSNTFQLYKDGKVIYTNTVNSKKSGDRDINEETIFPIWSMSKTVTTVAMMILYDRGHYNLEDNLDKYLPEFKDINCKIENQIYPCQNKIKIYQLLSHRSGYSYYVEGGESWLDNFTTNLYPYYTNPNTFDNLDDYTKAVSKIPLEFEPGNKYLYGLNQGILGRLIEVLSGQSFFEFLNQNIFIPLEMSETKFHLTTEEREKFQPLRVNIKPESDYNDSDYYLDGYTMTLNGYPYSKESKAHFGGEGLVSTMRDFSKFCKMLADMGTYNGQEIISENSYKIMTSSYTIPTGDDNEPNLEVDGYHYGFTFSVLNDTELDSSNATEGIFGWSGYHNTHYWIDPKKNMYALFMSRSIDFNVNILNELKRIVYEIH